MPQNGHCRLEVMTAVFLPNPLDTFAAVDSFISGRQKGRTMSSSTTAARTFIPEATELDMTRIYVSASKHAIGYNIIICIIIITIIVRIWCIYWNIYWNILHIKNSEEIETRTCHWHIETIFHQKTMSLQLHQYDVTYWSYETRLNKLRQRKYVDCYICCAFQSCVQWLFARTHVPHTRAHPPNPSTTC